MGAAGGADQGEAGPSSTRPRREDAPLLFVVEDDVATMELLCELAQEAGWEAHGYARLAELDGALDDRRPTLVVIDDDLPDGRGGDFARDLREDPRSNDVAVLVCTAAHPIRQAEIGTWAPVVSKPFDLVEVERFLDGAARNHADGRHRRQAAG